ncbi:MAG TPA: PQQ-dependent dehydrogenase, methanol/ethanol family [Candidatus Acidoferrales bacterium]|nr:PQQ-dependent dehydrogenase, methanol/ethanol family [Candidatus Acidoferrales bacterium]
MKLRLYLLAASLGCGCAAAARAQVSYRQILEAPQRPDNWLTYSGDYSGKRYSALDQVNAANVARLAAAWVFQTAVDGKFEATPLVIDGVMYATGPEDNAWALDARTGRTLWHYQRPLPVKIPACCGRVNRGFAALGNKLFMATLDGRVVALDAKTGNVIWDVAAADSQKGYTFTVAPLAVKDKVVVGISGGEYGVRGFVDAYDAETGRRAWRFYTVPGPGEPGHETWAGDSWQRGGAPAWITGSYDPELNLVYWPTGNPSPSDDTSERAGDNLYSNSVLALDADTGKLRWYFQFTPNDAHDWDATQVPVLLDMNLGGRPRKLLALANRNGFFYLLDRTSGQFLLARPFAHVTWASGVGPDGKPQVLPGTAPTKEGTVVCPGAEGATNWMSPSYSPQTNLFYVAAREQCDVFTASPQPFHPGRPYIGSVYFKPDDQPAWGALRALDPATGQIRWEFKYLTPPWGGALSTAGGLVFAGDMEGYLVAYDAGTGKPLWHFETGSPVYSAPMSYAIDGKQYIVVASGNALFAFALP